MSAAYMLCHYRQSQDEKYISSLSWLTCVTLVRSKQSIQLVLTTPSCSFIFSPFSFNKRYLSVSDKVNPTLMAIFHYYKLLLRQQNFKTCPCKSNGIKSALGTIIKLYITKIQTSNYKIYIYIYNRKVQLSKHTHFSQGLPKSMWRMPVEKSSAKPKNTL